MTALWSPDLVTPELLALTRAVGDPVRDLAILAEGNTSERLDGDRLVVKASGASLGGATEDDFVTIDIAEIAGLLSDPAADQETLTAALDAGTAGGAHRRASIEALMHVAIQHVAPSRFIAHSHPTAVLGLMSSVDAGRFFARPAYSDEAVVLGRPLFVPYAAPGILLGRAVHEALRERVEETGEVPSLILLENHGIVATAPNGEAALGVSEMAVKAARVRLMALSAGGMNLLSDEAVRTFFARGDIGERRRDLGTGQTTSGTASR